MNKKYIISMVALVTAGAAFAQVFPGAGAGAISDGGPGCGPFGPPLDVTFTVDGVFPPLSAVEVDISATHSWVGDLEVTLIAPDATEHVIFGGVGSTTATGCGDSSDLGGVYNFTDDVSAADFWAESLNGTGAYIMAAGDYFTSEVGDANPTGGTITSINDAFSAVADPNGTWTLRVIDGGAGDTGAVTAANLFLLGGPNPDVIFEDGFDTPGVPPV
jgi:hypothetical protein